MKTVRGVLRPAFQMAVDDDLLNKNPFGFQLAGVVVNDSVTREAISRDQLRKFLRFQPHGENIQRYLSDPDAEHHPARLPAYVLQQYGQGRHESEDTSVSYGS